QVLDHEKDSVDTWIISDRKHEYDKKTKKYFNSGYSKSYYKTKEKKKDFDLDNVKYSDITSVDEFEENLHTKLEGYYCGNTSGGSYNDESGKAYLVKYNKDGFVRLFYCGKFEGGHQCDNSGNAWDIVLDKQKKYYFYRRAKYKNDEIIYSTLRDHKDNMTGKQAEKKLKKKLGDITVDCELKWKNRK
ncbi:MAG: hypothetical protein K2K70_05935, partial [Lachnospiraceae bacterium]|nr:hypothetical protein [Lachnospiraceae bacterium]